MRLIKLERSGVFYRLPSAGASIKGGMLHTNTAIKGLSVEYKIKDAQWQVYSKPVAVHTPIKIRTKTKQLSRYGRTLTLEK